MHLWEIAIPEYIHFNELYLINKFYLKDCFFHFGFLLFLLHSSQISFCFYPVITGHVCPFHFLPCEQSKSIFPLFFKSAGLFQPGHLLALVCSTHCSLKANGAKYHPKTSLCLQPLAITPVQQILIRASKNCLNSIHFIIPTCLIHGNCVFGLVNQKLFGTD